MSKNTVGLALVAFSAVVLLLAITIGLAVFASAWTLVVTLPAFVGCCCVLWPEPD